jgi:hypothetical protein
VLIFQGHRLQHDDLLQRCSTAYAKRNYGSQSMDLSDIGLPKRLIDQADPSSNEQSYYFRLQGGSDGSNR